VQSLCISVDYYPVAVVAFFAFAVVGAACESFGVFELGSRFATAAVGE
jgi:hypothetical protein